jgi:hypothetical protein
MTVKLADFGLATTDMFTSDFGCGSTFYMSPGTSLCFCLAVSANADPSRVPANQPSPNVVLPVGTERRLELGCHPCQLDVRP